jgi:hypothetical protein
MQLLENPRYRDPGLWKRYPPYLVGSVQVATGDGGIYAEIVRCGYGHTGVGRCGNRGMSRMRDPMGSPNASIIRRDLVLPMDPHKGWDLNRSFPGFRGLIPDGFSPGQ